MRKGIVEIFDDWFDAKARVIHTMLPGKIERYDGHTTRKARVKILVKLRNLAGEVMKIPPIDNVPVVFPGSSKFNLLFPLSKGDGCMVVFSEEGIGAFLKGNVEVTADSFARFALTDAVCIPGLWSFRNVPTTTFTDEDNNTGLKLTGTNKLEVNNSLYNLGTLIFDLLDKIIALKTVGPPGSHTVLPAQQVTLTALKAKFEALLE